MNDATFEHSQRFEVGEVAGNVRLGKLEAMYEELYAEVIEDGIITQDERMQLDKMADNLGLDKARLRRLEKALQAAYEAHAEVAITDLSASAEASSSNVGAEAQPAVDPRTLALERRIKGLEARVAALLSELEEARSHVSVEVDFSDHAGAKATVASSAPQEDAAELARRLRHDPRDAPSLHALFDAYKKAGELDRQWCVAHVLSHLALATAEEEQVYQTYKEAALIRPRASVTQDAWQRVLSHPEEEPLVGEIFSVVVSAVLVGRLSALRRDKQLLKLDPARKQDPEKTTIQAVRCFHWAASILGMASPPLYVDPDYGAFVEMVPGVPPASRIGAKALVGRSAAELAFLAGRHLACYRETHFVKLLVPSARGLEDIFLAALLIGNPRLPMSAQVKAIVVPIAEAIEPVLESQGLDRLRAAFLRFVDEGGRTNLQRWTSAVAQTCARAGHLLANDLGAASAIYALEDPAHLASNMDDLLRFTLSDRYTTLRDQIGIRLQQA